MASTRGQRKVVYFLRHGESESNAAQNGSCILDPALTDKGRNQAEAWAAETPAWGVEVVYVSPLLRALLTASLAFRGSDVPLVVCRSAREHGWHEPQCRGSPLEQLQHSLTLHGCGKNVTRFRSMRKLAAPHKFWDPNREEGMERAELHRRRKEASKHLMKTLQTLLQSSNQTLAYVCHYNVIKSLCGQKLHNAEVARCIYEQKGRNWVLMNVQLLQQSGCARGVEEGVRECPPATSQTWQVKDDNDNASGSQMVEKTAGVDSDEDGCCEDLEIEKFWSSGSSGSEEDTIASLKQASPRSASVLIVGKSLMHDGASAVLLGGAKSRSPPYRYCDFGGGLDGGPWRCGGRAHAATERAAPHVGAFRELAEELLGLHGDDARGTAAALWAAAGGQLVGGAPVAHKRHLVYIVPAEALVATLCDEDQLRELSKSASPIDILARRFQKNSEVNDVTLASVHELLKSVNEDVSLIAPLTPVWGCFGDHGRLEIYSMDTAFALEQGRHTSGSVSVESSKRRYVISPQPSKMMQSNKDTGHCRTVFRWDQIALRGSLVGPTGSIASCSHLLRQLL